PPHPFPSLIIKENPFYFQLICLHWILFIRLLLKVFRLHKVIVHFLFIFLLFFEILNNTTEIKDIIKELYELIHYSSFYLKLFYLFNRDWKRTHLNSSHASSSYASFCLKEKDWHGSDAWRLLV